MQSNTRTTRVLILVADRYHSGTNDYPVLIGKNVEATTEASLALFRPGHLPAMGEWFALLLIEHAGLKGHDPPPAIKAPVAV